MPFWRVTLTYDGTPFHGWQIQPGRPTVQGTLAQAIHHITGEHVLPQGSGRTDTGVHALGQVASFHLGCPIPAKNLHHALNRTLPPAIRVLHLIEAPPDFHARHSALRKTYEYRILPRTTEDETICSPFLAPYIWPCRYPLSLDLLNEAATHILGTHDFTSFAAPDPDRTHRATPASHPAPPNTSNTRTIHHSLWTLEPSIPQNSTLVYRVTGSGFLHHMVRNLVGTFAECGASRLPPAAIPAILAARNRAAAGPTAPPNGLFLVEVEY